MNRDGRSLSNRALLIVSAVFILVVGGIFFLITGNGSRSNQKTANQAELTLVRPLRSVQLTVTGPIVANELRNSYSVNVAPSQRTVTLMNGYDSQIVNQSTYENNTAAYEQFVYALRRAKADSRRQISGTAAEERGVCATGRKYVFEIREDGRTVERLWTTSCRNSQGTLSASIDPIRSLFDKQIPDLSKFLRGAKF